MVHKHQTYRPPSPHRGRCSAWSSRDASFSRPISSVSWLAHQLLVHKIGPVCRGQGETKEADHSRLEGGSFNKTGNIHMRLILADCIVRTHQNLKIYIEAVTRFSHTHHPDGLSCTSLSQDCVLEKFLVQGIKWNAHAKTKGGGEKPTAAQVQLSGQLEATPS